MKKMNLVAAAITGLTFAASFISTVEAAPLAGAFAPTVESNVTSIAHRCWHGDQWVCAYRYYRYDPANYLTYGCPTYRRRHHNGQRFGKDCRFVVFLLVKRVLAQIGHFRFGVVA